MLAHVLGARGRQLVDVLEHRLERAVLGDQLAGGLVTDPRDAGDVVGGVALEADEIGHLVGPDAVAGLDARGRVDVDVGDAARRHHQRHVLGAELEGVPVGRDDAGLDPGLVGAGGERRDDVVRLPALELEVAVAERLDDRPEVRELLAQERRHLAAALLVDDVRRLGDRRPVHRPCVPGHGHAAGPVVGEELEEHVGEAEQCVRRLPVRRLQLLGQREERPVGEVVAVDEEQLGVTGRPVVELELGSGERLRRHRPNAIVRTGMAGPEIIPFTDEHLEGAATAARRTARPPPRVEPLLPAIVNFREHVEREWRTEGATGAVALENGEAVGYLIGQRREDAIGPHIWSFIAGQAVRTPELTRDLYRVTSARWVEEGLTRHFVYVPALPDLIEPWFRLSFGASAALATRETGPRAARRQRRHRPAQHT